jgi:hypothetical protein
MQATTTLTRVAFSRSLLHNEGTLTLTDAAFALSGIMYDPQQIPTIAPAAAPSLMLNITTIAQSRLSIVGGKVDPAVTAAFGNTANGTIAVTHVGELVLWGEEVPSAQGTRRVVAWILPRGTSVFDSLAVTLDRVHATMTPAVSLLGPFHLQRSIVECIGRCAVNGALRVFDSVIFQGTGRIVTSSQLTFDSSAPRG